MSELGRPPTTVLVCEEIQRLLLENGIPPNAKIPRPLWDELLAKARRVSWAQAENITRTGHQHGYWTRIPNVGRMPGSVVLRAMAQT
jgi:hypothetical protein